MTVSEFVDKYAKLLYDRNTLHYFSEVNSIIDNLKISGEAATLDAKIDIWKQIRKKVQELEQKSGESGLKDLYEHENGSVLKLINLTIDALEKDKDKEYAK